MSPVIFFKLLHHMMIVMYMRLLITLMNNLNILVFVLYFFGCNVDDDAQEPLCYLKFISFYFVLIMR